MKKYLEYWFEKWAPNEYKLEKLVFLGMVLGVGMLIAWLAVGREYLAFRVETDYLGRFVKEARNILEGRPLDLSVHPPLYPAAIAVVQFLMDDWVVTGLIISWISSVVVFFTQFKFFQKLEGSVAAFGAIVALLGSEVFLEYSATASSDMFSFALYSVTLLVLLQAATSGSPTLWLLGGVSMGATLLTRSNAIALLTMCLAPWMCGDKSANKVRSTGLVLTGLALPLLTWAVIASVTGSPILPKNNYANLATTFFGAPKLGGVNNVDRFSNLADVLFYDPGHLIQVYMSRGAETLKQLFTPEAIVPLAVTACSLPGLAIIFVGRKDPFKTVFALTTLAHILVVNFTYYQHRFFMFLMPILGAAAAVAYTLIVKNISKKLSRYLVHTTVVLLLVVSFSFSLTGVLITLHAQDKELKGVDDKIKKSLEEGSTIIARKPHIPYYAETNGKFFPDLKSLDSLRTYLGKIDLSEPTYLYYGSAESQFRPELSKLREGDVNADWLEPVMKEKAPGAWTLYRVRLEPSPDSTYEEQKK